jgi:hypothetical protein
MIRRSCSVYSRRNSSESGSTPRMLRTFCGSTIGTETAASAQQQDDAGIEVLADVATSLTLLDVERGPPVTAPDARPVGDVGHTPRRSAVTGAGRDRVP